MTMMHLNPDLLRKVLDGELPPRTLLRLLLDHMLDLCPECRAAWEEARVANPALAAMVEGEDDEAVAMAAEAAPDLPTSPTADAGPYADAFERAARALAGEHLRVETERERAERELQSLLSLAPQERRPRVERAPGRRFRGRELVQRLLETSLETVRRDAAEALDLAELAAVVLERSLQPGYVLRDDGESSPAEAAPDWAHELSLRCLAHAANALRVRGQLPAADLMFGRLERRRRERGVSDGLVAAELASLEASLRLDQRRFHTAAGLLERASRAYDECGSAEGRAKVDLQRAALLRQQGDAEDAAELLAGVIAADAAGSPLPASLRRHAVANRALVLCDLDRAAEARRLLADQRALFAGGDAWERLRLGWLHGRIALGLEELDEARVALEEARRGFLERDEGFNAALVSLDLAAVHATAGRTAAVKELAAGLEPVFASRDVDRETVATLVLFQRAAAAEEAGRELILRLRQVLERGHSGRKPAVRPS